MGKIYPKTENCIGKRYGRLIVLEVVQRQSGARLRTYFVCECDCGNVKEISSDQVKRRKASSCGCLRTEIVVARSKTHGMSHTRLHNIWMGLRRRCYDSADKRYDDWGGRGIKICDEWQTFEPFRDWALSHGYTDELTIERKNNDGDYTPDNCCWADYFAQARNQRVQKNSTSGIKGVSLPKGSRKWLARIAADGKNIRLGLFDTVEEATEARRQAEIKYWNKDA